MEELTRTASGQFTLKDSHSLGEIQQAANEGTAEKLVIGIEEILGEYPRICCMEAGDRLLANGNPIMDTMMETQHKDGWIRMCSSSGNFVGIYQWDKKKQKYQPVKMFL